MLQARGLLALYPASCPSLLRRTVLARIAAPRGGGTKGSNGSIGADWIVDLACRKQSSDSRRGHARASAAIGHRPGMRASVAPIRAKYPGHIHFPTNNSANVEVVVSASLAHSVEVYVSLGVARERKGAPRLEQMSEPKLKGRNRTGHGLDVLSTDHVDPILICGDEDRTAAASAACACSISAIS